MRALHRNPAVDGLSVCGFATPRDVPRELASQTAVYAEDEAHLASCGCTVGRDVGDRERVTLRPAEKPRTVEEVKAPAAGVASAFNPIAIGSRMRRASDAPEREVDMLAGRPSLAVGGHAERDSAVPYFRSRFDER